MSLLKRILCSAIVIISLISPALTPAFALDYEAKPINSIITAPFHLAGAVTGGAVCGLFSGPVDDGFNAGKKATSRIASALGDENGKLEILVAAPIGFPLGLVVGGVRGFGKGVAHGTKTGWEKPFSRWSYVTMEEK